MKDKLITVLTENTNDNKSIPFWSWNNQLDEEYLIGQIEDMKRAGMGGFIMHARTGLKSEYLGEKWFSCIGACLKKAKELNMQAWIYDENGWPSGFVGGKLLEKEDYRARFLEYNVGEFDNAAFCIFIKDEKLGYKRVNGIIDGVSEYHNIFLRISPANTDILNPEVVDEFILETHEKYYQRFKDSFGKELVGFFTDEPQYYRAGTPYTPIAESIFATDGENIKDGLIWLFVKDERGYEFRYKYFKTLNQLYTQNFYNKIYKWCNEHNCKLTGHSVEEPQLFTQMWGGAAVMPSYEYEHIPAIDCLGYGYQTELAEKQVASVASQLGKKYVLTETFACSGYDVTPNQLKGIAENQYFYGVNVTCQHLYPFSLAGRGKIDHPPVFGKQSNWFDEFKVFNDYFTRLGRLISNTEEMVDIAILHPMRNVWLDYIRSLDYQSVKTLEDDFNELLVTLRKKGVTYHLVDERILEKHGKVEGDCLVVGKRKYHTLLIPKMKNIASFTHEILKEYKGKLCCLSDLSYVDGIKRKVDIESNITFEEILSNTKVKFKCEDANTFITTRSSELGDFIFVKNRAMDKTSRIQFKNVAENYVYVDLMTFETHCISNEMDIAPNESLILMGNDSAKEVKVCFAEKDVTNSFKVESVTENYLVLDYAMTSKSGIEYTDNRPISGLFEDLLREDYKGVIFVKQQFTLNDKMNLKFIVEKAKFMSFKLNGKDVTFSKSDFDINFLQGDISDLVKIGKNEIVYCFDFYQHDGVHFALFNRLSTESLVNCLYYDTTIEPTYIKGDFIVEKDRSLSKRTKLPTFTSELYKNGYPFFKGELTFKGNIRLQDIRDISLRINGKYLVANIYVNGNKVDCIFDKSCPISQFLRVGENEIKVVVKSSLRNLFGPHHFDGSLEGGVSPYNFDFRKRWIDGQIPDNYTHEYISAPFGIDSIKIIKKI